MATIIQHIATGEKFVLIKSSIDSILQIVADKDGNIYNLRELQNERDIHYNENDHDKNIFYHEVYDSEEDFDKKKQLSIKENKTLRISFSYIYNINYKVIQIDGNPISELLK